MRVVIDTNVLVSALLSPFGPPAQLLRLIVSGSVSLVLDDRIYVEYSTVLMRPLFEFNLDRVEELLDFVATEGEFVVSTPLKIELPDPDDLPFLEVAVTSEANMIITGNQKHFPKKITEELRVIVQSPRLFIDVFSQQHGK